ncbi:MAG: hypothetical protein ACI4KR_09205 [Ruminiclostridium sp.]
MDGITILNIYDGSNGAAIMFTIMWITIIIILIVTVIWDMIRDDVYFTSIISLFLSAVCIVASIISIKDLYDKMETLEVLIDDDVSMTDFHKKYEIVSTRGEIYVIREINKTEHTTSKERVLS